MGGESNVDKVVHEMTESFSHISADFYDYYMSDYLSAPHKGSIMPCAPLTRSYDVAYSMKKNEEGDWYLHCVGDFELTDWSRDLIEEFGFESDRIQHRSRIVSIASSILRYKELRRRVERRKVYQHYLTNLSNIYNPKMSELVKFRTEVFKKYAGTGGIEAYVGEHKLASVIPGVKWATLDIDEVKTKLFERVYETAISMPNYHGQVFTKPFFNGMRTRALSLGEATVKQFDPVTGMLHVEGDITRTRIVNFHPRLSLSNMALENKVAYYDEIVSWAKDQIGLESEVYTPMIAGGQVYKIGRAMYEKGYEYKAIDAKNHESNVIEVLGPCTYPWSTQVDDQRHEPSGVDNTSLFNLVCTMCFLKELEAKQGPVTAIMLGDDMDIFFDGTWKCDDHELFEYGILEEDEKDTKNGFVLGLSVLPEHEGLLGLKVMMDRADKMIGVSNMTDGDFSHRRRIDMRIAGFIYDAWHGRLKGYDIIDVMAGIEAADYKGAGQMIESIVEERGSGSIALLQKLQQNVATKPNKRRQ